MRRIGHIMPSKKREKMRVGDLLFFTATIYPALKGSNTPTSKFDESKEVRWKINCP
ncbi:hypothetical protein [Bacillus pseudomycoides]|uniref:hypothetical protein n=1 Tax=Bacillus pseudomycoides TaxID=64104 RepID=UPI001FB4F4B2|nr:hypothetical protein [Bacillus pseudomycoides]